MLDVIKEYLVSLGFKTDNSSLNSAQAAMKSAEASVTSFTNSSVKSFAKAATAVVSFVATANIALGKYLVSLAESDLQTEMFARRMWMSKDAAKAYQASIDALGVSINDLYLSPELMDKYLELNRQARDMSVSAEEYDKQMRSVRDITFQFQRLKLEGTYALQWIGYYLTKYLAGPLGDSRDWLTKINDKIQETMPQWTKKVAEVASWFVRLGAAAWSIRGALGAVLGVFMAFKMINMLTNPLGLLILGMTTLLLLVDDFNTYKDGGESAFPKLWEWVEKFKQSLEDNGYLKDFSGILKDVIQEVKDFGAWLEKVGRSETFQNLMKKDLRMVEMFWNGLKEAWGWLKNLYQKMEDSGLIESFGKTFGDLVQSAVDLDNAIMDLIESLGGTGGLGDILSSVVVAGLGIFRDTLESIAGLITIIAGGIRGIATGDFSGMEKGFKIFMNGIPKGLKDAWEGTFNDTPSVSGGPDDPAFSRDTHSVAQVSFSNFKNSIPGASNAPTVDWGALKKGFVAFMNSIPKEFGDISKGLFQTVKSYGDSGGSIAGSMSYLYPQTTSSHMTQLTLKPTYHIYGTKDPQSVATTVNRASTSMLTRWGQGVIR